jgi:class 3 adenylate cyclase
MRLLKSFLILLFFTTLVVVLLHLVGAFIGAGTVWQNLIHASALHPFANGLPQFPMALALILVPAFLWIGLGSSVREMMLLALTALLLVLGASLVASLYLSYLNPVPSIAALLLSVIAVTLYWKTEVGSRGLVLRRLFGQRLRPEIFRQLVDGELSVDFPGEMHEASVLVCSIHNHVELMEVLKPADYVALMNLYLRTASDFLVDVGGYLDECSGESVRAVFGVPLPSSGIMNHAAKAARGAIDLVSRLEELNRECDNRWLQRLDFRIGVNSGPMIAAAYGGARLGRYSVSGPVVDFTRHLSAACAQYGCRILSGPLSYERASETVEGRPIDLLQRAGSRRRVELYEFLAPKNSLSPERERSRDQFWKGVILFRERKWEEAIKAFSSARIPGIPDKVLDHYLERVERARRGDDELTPEQALLAEAV